MRVTLRRRLVRGGAHAHQAFAAEEHAQRRERRDEDVEPAPHKDFSDLYEKMSGKGDSASEAHRRSNLSPFPAPSGSSIGSVAH